MEAVDDEKHKMGMVQQMVTLKPAAVGQVCILSGAAFNRTGQVTNVTNLSYDVLLHSAKVLQKMQSETAQCP